MPNSEDPGTDLEYDDEALMLMRQDASKTLERTLQKHDAHQKKATQLIQINGVVISLLLAAGSQVGLNCLLVLGGASFVISALLSGYALRGARLKIALSSEQIASNIEAELTKNQYLRWYFEHFYYQSFKDLNKKTTKRAERVRNSLRAFLGGIVLIAIGIVIQFPV